MSIASDMNDWQTMLYGSQQSDKQKEGKVSTSVDSNSDIPLEPEPVVEYDYDAEMKELRKVARRTVMSLAKLILPKDMLNEDYVKNKIEQDVQTLAELYWTRRSNEIMKLSAMDSIAKGNTAPRMYDVYKDLTVQINENNKQLLATEDNLRKVYIDLKYEIQRKRVEEMNDGGLIIDNSGPQLKQQEAISTKAYTGTKELIDRMKELQKDKFRENSSIIDI